MIASAMRLRQRRHAWPASASCFLLVVASGCAMRVRTRSVAVHARGCAQAVQPASLSDYWNGRAAWKLFRVYPTGTGGPYGEGAHITVRDGTWYAFSRRVDSASPPTPYCPQRHLGRMGIEVRRSSDEGLTWSPPLDVVVPTPGTPWECAATDGAAYFDAQGGRWHYLFQCMGRDRLWNGCRVERIGPDPMGQWQGSAAGGLAVASGSLWNRICQPGTRCAEIAGGPGRVAGEGTFDVFHDEGGYHFVSFHGYDGTHGFRGVAKTADFVDWIAGDPSRGTPGDAVFTARDADGWREVWNEGGPVGGGAGGILPEEDGRFYMLVESADLNLGCTPGQTWDVGLLRSPTLTQTPWEQPPQGNPIFYSSRSETTPCSPSYSRLFKDPASGFRYLSHHRASADPSSDGLYVYRLVLTTNRLDNADFWRCDAHAWRAAGIRILVPRNPALASDGGCALEIQCESSGCHGGVMQEVPAEGLATVAFGGRFTARGAGTITAELTQLDALGSVLARERIRIPVSAAYQAQSRLARVVPGALRLRYGLVVVGPATVHADELFVSPCAQDR